MTDAPTDGSPAVRVEVLFLRAGAEPGSLLHRRSGAPVLAREAPQDVALRLGGGPGGLALLHSTSWRHDPDDGLVLTYVAVPDPEPAAPATPLVEASIVSSGDPVRPQPELLHGHHVVAHAVRHLAELAVRDPAVAEAARTGDRTLWERVAQVAAAVPTGTHAEAHAVAGGRAAAPAVAGPALDGSAPDVPAPAVPAPGTAVRRRRAGRA